MKVRVKVGKEHKDFQVNAMVLQRGDGTMLTWSSAVFLAQVRRNYLQQTVIGNAFDITNASPLYEKSTETTNPTHIDA